MGSRNRPAVHVDESFDRHVNVMVTRAMPISLTPAELALERHPPREAAPGEGVAVSAWVRFPETPVLVTAVVLKWTDTAVLVRWEAGDGRTLEAWVWKGAATRR
jgi:hypothetical protein